MKKYLYMRHGYFYFRRRIPQKILHYFPYTEIRVSLNTNNLNKAFLCCGKINSEMVCIFDILKSHLFNDLELFEIVKRFLKRVKQIETDSLSIQMAVKEEYMDKSKGKSTCTSISREFESSNFVYELWDLNVSLWNIINSKYKNKYIKSIRNSPFSERYIYKIAIDMISKVFCQICLSCKTTAYLKRLKQHLRKIAVIENIEQRYDEDELIVPCSEIQEIFKENKINIKVDEPLIGKLSCLLGDFLRDNDYDFWKTIIKTSWIIDRIKFFFKTIKFGVKNSFNMIETMEQSFKNVSVIEFESGFLEERILENYDISQEYFNDLLYIQKKELKKLLFLISHSIGNSKDYFKIENGFMKAGADKIELNSITEITYKIKIDKKNAGMLSGFIQMYAELAKRHLDETGQVPILVQAGTVIPNEAKAKKSRGIKLSELIEDFINECSGDWSEKTSKDTPPILRTILRILGDVYVNDILTKDMKRVSKTLLELPLRWRSKKEFKGKSVDQILKMDHDKTLSVNTVRNHITWYSRMFNYAVRNRYMDANPASEAKPKERKRKSQYTDCFSADDMQQLLESPLYNPDHEDYIKVNENHPERQWLPLIGMFSGMRQNEMCQLKVDDIQKVGGIYCFNLYIDSEEDHIKNAGTQRLVPIHPILIKLGFLDYVEECNKSGYKRLWMQLRSIQGKYNPDFSGFFSTYKKRYLSDNKKLKFHSFRHNLMDNLKQQLLSSEVISEIAGHAHTKSEETFNRYGKEFDPKTKLDVLQKLDYGIDILGILKKRGLPEWNLKELKEIKKASVKAMRVKPQAVAKKKAIAKKK